MTNSARRIGVILAAGRGRRMGQTKQLLDWPTREGIKSMVAVAFDAIQPVCRQMVVVLGADAAAVAQSLGTREYEAVHSDPDAPMANSVKLGLATAQRCDDKAEVLLHPSDHPQVSLEALQRLVETAAANPGCVVMPEFKNQGGHPVLIPATMIDKICQSELPGGLRQFWHTHPERCRRVAVDDASVVRDVDTPEDYKDSCRA